MAAFVQEFSTIVPEIQKTLSFAAMTEHLRGIVSLDSLRSELRRFLSSQNLPTKLVDDGAWWAAFNLMYIAVVAECPLSLRGGYELRVKHSTTRFVPRPPAPKRDTVLVSEWVLLKDGNTVATLYNEGHMETVTVTMRMEEPGGPVTTTVVRNA